MYSILQCSANILYTDFTNKLLVSESDAVRLRFCGRRVCIQCTDVKRYFCIHIASLIILHEKHRVVNVTLRAAPCEILAHMQTRLKDVNYVARGRSVVARGSFKRRSQCL